MPSSQPTSLAVWHSHSTREWKHVSALLHQLWNAAVDLLPLGASKGWANFKHQSSSRANGTSTDGHMRCSPASQSQPVHVAPVRACLPARWVRPQPQKVSALPFTLLPQHSFWFGVIIPKDFHLQPPPSRLGSPDHVLPVCTIRGPHSSRAKRAHRLPALSTPAQTSLNRCA